MPLDTSSVSDFPLSHLLLTLEFEVSSISLGRIEVDGCVICGVDTVTVSGVIVIVGILMGSGVDCADC